MERYCKPGRKTADTPVAHRELIAFIGRDGVIDPGPRPLEVHFQTLEDTRTGANFVLWSILKCRQMHNCR